VETVDAKENDDDMKKSVSGKDAPIENAEDPKKVLRVSAVSQSAPRKMSNPRASKGESA
jgi:hypothetical protein